MSVEPPTSPSPSPSAPRICQPRGHGAAAPPQSLQKVGFFVQFFFFLLLTSVRHELESVHIDGVKGMVKDNILAVHLVLRDSYSW